MVKKVVVGIGMVFVDIDWGWVVGKFIGIKILKRIVIKI